MSETRRIRGILKAVNRGPGWHGPSLAENLEGITAEMAAKHPIAGAHSIWEIVLHVSTWEREVSEFLTGKPYVTMEGEADWPPVKDTSEEAWHQTLAQLRTNHLALADAIKRFNEEDLEKVVPGKDFPWWVVLHGMAHHSLYHSGQIAMLKKAAK
jgi:uncharacterized damage-inducible protein DinB